LVISTKSKDETLRLGRKIAGGLKAGDVVAFYGGLGAGKTTLIQGIASGLGIKNYVTSPTFTIINEFKGKVPLFHVDLYRMHDLYEIETLALEEYFDKGGIVLIEWAEKMGETLPSDAKSIKIKVLSENGRTFTLKGIKI
jgi:tRNA threonylcarbamoyladenosine biosynthesis protein TsaE